jgi:hypothetical protein
MRRRFAAAVIAAGAATYALVVRGDLTLDLGVGRRQRRLGPLLWTIRAPRKVVYEVISEPYLGRTPRALESKLRVLERAPGMVLAEHFTPVGPLVATTLETVRFEPPERIHFRLVRGPAPHVVEQFVLRESRDGTELEYVGELGTDLWRIGELWGAAVARRWERAVRSSLGGIAAEAERRAARART